MVDHRGGEKERERVPLAPPASYYEGDDKGWGEYTAVIGQERETVWMRNLGR